MDRHTKGCLHSSIEHVAFIYIDENGINIE